MINEELFRKEVSQVSSAKLYGKVRLSRPRIYLVASCISMIMLAILVACAALVPIKRRALAYGLIVNEQGASNILAPIAGIIGEVYSKEGDPVSAGSLLFKVTNEVQTPGMTNSVQSLVQNLEARRQTFELDRLQAARRAEQMSKLLHEKLSGYDSEIARLRSLASLESEKLSLVRRRESEISTLVNSGFVSKSQFVDRQLEVLNQKVLLEDLGRQLEVLLRSKLSTTQELEAVRADRLSAGESMARSIASLDQELTEMRQRGERVLRSPRDGVVTGLLSSPGNTVSAGQLLAVIIPDHGKLGAEVYIPAKFISRVLTGMNVEIRYEAFPYQKYGQFVGQIAAVTGTPIQPVEFSNVPGIRSTIVGTEPVYRVSVMISDNKIDGHALRPGMALSAAIISEDRTILRWLLDDFYQTIKQPSAGV